jgi:hypothetical protein
MSKYEEVCKAFAESFECQNEHFNDCCEFATFVFDKMREYFEWPRELMMFVNEKSLKKGMGYFRCSSDVAIPGKDGYLNFRFGFIFQRLNNPNSRYQVIIPTKIRKFEESFFIKLGDQGKEFFFNKNDTVERQKFFEDTLERLKRHFDTPFLDWNVPSFLGDNENDMEDESESEE